MAAAMKQVGQIVVYLETHHVGRRTNKFALLRDLATFGGGCIE